MKLIKALYNAKNLQIQNRKNIEDMRFETNKDVLDWYEKRELSDMPKYLKLQGEIHKVFEFKEAYIRYDTLYVTLPSTEQEYLQYLKSIK